MTIQILRFENNYVTAHQERMTRGYTIVEHKTYSDACDFVQTLLRVASKQPLEESLVGSQYHQEPADYVTMPSRMNYQNEAYTDLEKAAKDDPTTFASKAKK